MNVLVDDIETVVKSMRGSFDSSFDSSFGQTVPYYDYGHRQEISDRLIKKGQDPSTKNKKYPLIALRLDTPELVQDGYQNYNLNIAILTYNDKKYNTPERYANVIKPILYPLYDMFFKKLAESGLFTWEPAEDTEWPEHTKIDRPYWGTPDPNVNTANIFVDPIDAIEILDLKIKSRIRCKIS